MRESKIKRSTLIPSVSET